MGEYFWAMSEICQESVAFELDFKKEGDGDSSVN